MIAGRNYGLERKWAVLLRFEVVYSQAKPSFMIAMFVYSVQRRDMCKIGIRFH